LDNLDAKLHPGYYFFVAYCLVSNIAFQFLDIPAPDAVNAPAAATPVTS
jgi:hypothetical protein